MKRYFHIVVWIIAFCSGSPLLLVAQEVRISFDTEDFVSIGVYDCWEESPFRNGAQRLEGNVAVVDNCLQMRNNQTGLCSPDTVGNKMLAFQRSRYGSNVFGARVDLAEPFFTGDKTKYVHAFIHRPIGGRVMLVGLGKRTENTTQAPDTEQFWVFSTNTVAIGRWADAVFPVRTADGVEIHSLVVVPHSESPHELTEDFAVFIDEIEVNDDETPRVNSEDVSGMSAISSKSIVEVRTFEGEIRIRVVDGGQVVLSDASGRVFYMDSLIGEKSFCVPAGVYVVNGRKFVVP